MKSFVGTFLLLLAASGPAFAASSLHGAAGDGLTDDTLVIQSAIDALPKYGVLDGGGRKYLVGALKLKSQMTMQNFQFVTRSSSVPGTVPVTLDGSVSPIVEVRIDNVHVDGNRAGQTNLSSPEDGARDGFRIVGVARDIWILNSSARNCATDGLKIFSADVQPPPGSLNFTNIWVVNGDFSQNRRHGFSLDSAREVHLINVRMNGNGLPSPVQSGTATEGETPYLVDGMLYGAGLVVEGYNPAGGVDGVNIVGCTAKGNARFGIQFWESSSPRAKGFLARANIRIESSSVDGGVSATHGRQAIEFGLPYGTIGTGYVYRNVTLANNEIAGTVIVNGTAQFRLIGGRAVSPYAGFFGGSQGSADIVVQGVNSSGKAFVQR